MPRRVLAQNNGTRTQLLKAAASERRTKPSAPAPLALQCGQTDARPLGLNVFAGSLAKERGEGEAQPDAMPRDPRQNRSAAPVWIAVRRTPDGCRVDGVLRSDGIEHEACLGIEPGQRRMRLWAQVAKVSAMKFSDLMCLLAFQAGSAFCRWNWHPEIGGLLTLEANACVGRDLSDLAAARRLLARDCFQLLRNDRLDALLEHLKARRYERIECSLDE